ncbi:MAG: hypothetical protein K8R53_09275 [Bacteroidales bacterium]|nr:hypothetical protein [Bacteroidales bacterium]
MWKLFLGKGETVISRKIGSKIWAGAGWTGQPLIIEENGRLFLIQGAYDHHLKKIDALTGDLIWQYQFDDVVKGTGTFYENRNESDPEKRFMLFQGSRLGVGNYLDSKHIPCFRAISYVTGKELWRLDVRWTDSYSRDADGSPLIIGNRLYAGLENSMLTIIDPDPSNVKVKDNMLQPVVLKEVQLYEQKDVELHRNNVVTESSLCILNNHIYITSGAGHLYGYNLTSGNIDWDFYVGSDLDGSPVITSDSCIIFTVEKQYIQGKGGVFKINPEKNPEDCVVWYFPCQNSDFGSWEGGVIGSASVNDLYYKSTDTNLAVFSAIDGFLYVVNHKKTGPDKNPGPNNKNWYPEPELIYKHKTGQSISTPIIVQNKVIAAGYGGIYLFSHDREYKFQKTDHFETEFEATPVVHNRKIFVASRDGNLYCFGEID